MSGFSAILFLFLFFPAGTIYVAALFSLPIRAYKLKQRLDELDKAELKDEAQIKKDTFARNIAVGASIVLWLPFIVYIMLNG